MFYFKYSFFYTFNSALILVKIDLQLRKKLLLIADNKYKKRHTFARYISRRIALETIKKKFFLF